MPLSATRLSASFRARLLDVPGFADNASLTAMCDALAAATVEEVQLATVTFPIGAIQVAGSAVAQTNPAPCTGGTVA